MFEPKCGYTLAEYGLERPSMVIRHEYRTVTLDAGLNRFEWAHGQ
jgi:hypothetical protein